MPSLVPQHLKELKDKDPIMEGVLLETENMLARGRMDLPLSLCFATLRGDDLLLHHLLKRGLDPNECDNTGRTPLVSTHMPSLFTKFQLAITTIKMHVSNFISSINVISI